MNILKVITFKNLLKNIGTASFFTVTEEVFLG